MFGIIDENKKFILLAKDINVVRTTALMLSVKTEEGFTPMFTEDTVDEAIKEYTDKSIETAYNGEKYLKGFVPAIDNEYQKLMREKAYVVEVDPITAHISRLRDINPESTEIIELIAERKTKIAEIKEKYPYSE